MGEEEPHVSILSPYVRRKLREYHADLLRRVRLAVCPVCGAKPRAWCVSYGQRKEWCHRKRHLEAKHLGTVKGLTIAQRRARENLTD